MKKFALVLLSLLLLLSLAACGDKNGTPEQIATPAPITSAPTTAAPTTSDPTTAAPTTSDSTASAPTTPESTTVSVPEAAPAPAIPEGYEEVEIESEYYGVKLTFAGLNDGRFVDKDVKLDKNNLKQGTTNWEVKYVSDAEWRNSNYLNYKLRIFPDSGSNLERDMKRGVVLENHKYTAFLSEEIGENECKVTFMTDENSYFDGRMCVVADLVAYKGFMSAEDFKTAAETFIDTLTIELLEGNGMNDADGSFPSYSGVFTVPAKLTVDGRELTTAWTVIGSRARAAVSFTTDDGTPVTIVEGGKNVPKYVSSRYEDEEHYRHVQFGDYYGICDRDTGKGNVEHEYTVVFQKDGDSETNMTFSVIWGAQGGMNAAQLREFFGDEAKVAELNGRLDAYAEEYISQIVYNGVN